MPVTSQGSNEKNLERYQLAEIKHARLAMIAFSGFTHQVFCSARFVWGVVRIWRISHAITTSVQPTQKKRTNRLALLSALVMSSVQAPALARLTVPRPPQYFITKQLVLEQLGNFKPIPGTASLLSSPPPLSPAIPPLPKFLVASSLRAVACPPAATYSCASILKVKTRSRGADAAVGGAGFPEATFTS